MNITTVFLMANLLLAKIEDCYYKNQELGLEKLCIEQDVYLLKEIVNENLQKPSDESQSP